MSLINKFCGNVQVHVLYIGCKNCPVEEMVAVEQGAAMQEVNKRLLKSRNRHFYFKLSSFPPLTLTKNICSSCYRTQNHTFLRCRKTHLVSYLLDEQQGMSSLRSTYKVEGSTSGVVLWGAQGTSFEDSCAATWMRGG